MTMATADQLEPFYFGPPGRELYGCYHEARGWPVRDQGVVLCYPGGQEYLRAHRAFRQLAARITRGGLAALRFDYYGTGDSAGDDAEVTLDQWQADALRAVAELRARSGVRPVLLVGLRLGASIALQVAPRTAGLAGLVLWEPVVTGRAYLEELTRQHTELVLRSNLTLTTGARAAPPAELLGFALSDTFRAELDALNLLEAPPPDDVPVLLIESGGRPESARLRRHLEASGRCSYTLVPSFSVWTEDVDKGLVPQPVIDAIGSWLERVTT